VTDAVLDEFKQFLAKEKVSFSDTDMAANLDFVKNRIRIQLVGAIFGETDADRINVSSDPLVLKSLEDMPQAKELLAKAKRYVATKTQR
jgi:carboxyl-terminal processing protease